MMVAPRQQHPPTARQLEVLDSIADSIAERGFPPTTRELAVALGMSQWSSAGVSQHLDALERKGLVHRHPGVSRGITLSEVGKALVAERKAARQ